MAKSLKLNIKNVQLAKAIDLDNIKDKIAKKKADEKKAAKKTAKKAAAPKKTKAKKVKPVVVEPKEEQKTATATSKEKTEVKPTTKKVVAPKIKVAPEVAPKEKKETKKTEPTKTKVGEKKPKTVEEQKKKKPLKISQEDLKKDDLFQSFGAKKHSRPSKPSKYKGYKDIKSIKQYKPHQRRSKPGQKFYKRQSQSQQYAAAPDLPTQLKIQIPISVKDLAAEMKIKASEIITKLFMHGIATTINDYLEDETTIQLIGQELECEITIDTAEEELIQITDKTIEEEIKEADEKQLEDRAPIIAFMGHVDHGKTSLIDVIRNSNIVAGEKGAITQHIGAFRYVTDHGTLTIIDTPGHEAFTAMRKRGAHVTDIVILVVAGDEGVKDQTIEAINHAKESGATIIVAINKSDKAGFNAENVYRQLADQELLPEAWGGETITINCSATTKEGVKDLLEMVLLQSEVLELKAIPSARARGIVLESAIHKGLGTVATVLVQNGLLKYNDSLVFDNTWGRVKTMHNEFGKDLQEAAPSVPVRITGLVEVPKAGEEFIAVKSEKEARKISEMRAEGKSHVHYREPRQGFSAESLFKKSEAQKKKMLNVILRTDVHGSLEALKTCLSSIKSEKAILNIISSAVGEISESDVELAEASSAIIVGFQTPVESNADPIIKERKVTVLLHNVIYHVIDEIKHHMQQLLDKIPQENEKGEAKVKAVFKSSQVGRIAGCLITKGSIHRNSLIRVVREDEVVWKGKIGSIKKGKEDLREIQKDNECGIVLDGFNDIQEDDMLQAYEIMYIEQQL